MPIVDGLTSTKMIRSFEKCHPREATSDGPSSLPPPQRIPIFAVSASLLEQNKEQYIDSGFDGWILKPVDFRRITTLLNGIIDSDVRERAIYEPGHWERGGWFTRSQQDIFAADTKPSAASPVLDKTPLTRESSDQTICN
jgi:hypothetical protein